MGQRANLAIVTDDGFDLYYTHWRANTLDADLFWGPAHAEAFIRSCQPQEDGEWLNDTWAEGGAVLDPATKTLLWFGGEDILYSPRRRQVHLDLMRSLWPGWTLQWARGDIVDIARYVGASTDGLADTSHAPLPELPGPIDDPWQWQVLSLRREDGTCGAMLQCDLEPSSVLFAGPALVDPLHAAALDSIAFTSDHDHELTLALHIDEVDHTVHILVSEPVGDLDARLTHAWPGWSVVVHRDPSSLQELLAGHVTWTLPDLHATLKRIARTVLAQPFDHSNLIADIVARTDSTITEVNPRALIDAPPPQPTEPEELFRTVVDAYLASPPAPATPIRLDAAEQAPPDEAAIAQAIASALRFIAVGAPSPIVEMQFSEPRAELARLEDPAVELRVQDGRTVLVRRSGALLDLCEAVEPEACARAAALLFDA